VGVVNLVVLACVMMATIKKGRQLFWGKKCTPEKTWLRLWLRLV